VTDRPRALAVLIAVLLVGCIIGSAGSFIWTKRPFGPFNQDRGYAESRNRPPGPGGPGPGQGRRRLTELLQLTPDQEKQFREIMAKSRKQLSDLQVEQMPKIEAIRIDTNRRLTAILNPEQRKKFETFVQEMESRRIRIPRQFDAPMRPMQPPPGERKQSQSGP